MKAIENMIELIGNTPLLRLRKVFPDSKIFGKCEFMNLITGSGYNWYNEWNFVELHPTLPFHIFNINK